MHHTEISLTGNVEHDTHVTGDIFSYTTHISDQNVRIDQRDPLYTYKATSDPDIMYLHEAMKISDWPKFRLAMQKEIDDRMEGKNFSVIHKSKFVKTATVLPVVW